MEIKINPKLESTLLRLAEQVSLLPNYKEAYLENIIESHLLANFKSELVNIIQSQSIDDLTTFETPIKTLSDEIKVRDEVIVESKEVAVVDEIIAVDAI
jgi:hypothetical protein